MPESLVVVVVVVVDDDDNDDVVAAAADAAILVVMGDAFERYDNVMIINAIFCYQRYFCITVSIIMTRLSFYCFTIIPSSSSFFLCSNSRGGDVTVYVCDKPTELAHSFLFCACIYLVFMALSTVLHSTNSPDNSPFSHSVLPVLFLSY